MNRGGHVRGTEADGRRGCVPPGASVPAHERPGVGSRRHARRGRWRNRIVKSRKRHTKTLTRGDADQMVAAVRVTNRSGAPVTQPTRVTSVTSLGVKQPTVEHPDDESSEWLSEWGDAPAGPSGFGPSKLRPGWKGGGEAPGPTRRQVPRVTRHRITRKARAHRAPGRPRAAQPRHRGRRSDLTPMARH